MLHWPFLRLIITLLLAAGLALGGAGFFGTSAHAAPIPADCPHHANPTAEQAADHGDTGHEHGGKTGGSKHGGCHCPLMTCSGWTLAPVATGLLPFKATAMPHRPTATAAFVPYSPGVPLHPPRA